MIYAGAIGEPEEIVIVPIPAPIEMPTHVPEREPVREVPVPAPREPVPV